MRAIMLAVGMLLITGAANATTATYKLADAVKKKLVTVNISGAKPDTTSQVVYPDRAPVMSMEVISTSADALNLDLEYGYKMVPDDSSYQTMMVSQTLFVKLQPKQRKSYRVYAFCTEATDHGPSAKMDFDLGSRTTGSLLNLAELINRKKYQNDAAQNAVWCLTDDHAVQSIFSDDTTIMYELRRFVAKAKGLDAKSIYEAASNITTQPARVRTTTYSGVLNYSMGREAKVLIALFDEENHMKKVYVNNETKRMGEYTCSYEIKSDEMNGKRHYLRMYRDGRLEEEISIIPRD